MDALGALNPLEVVEAQIQKKIGRFLVLKSVLLPLRDRHGSMTIREEAAGLMALQTRLEGRLTEVLEQINQFKSGAWSFGNVIEVSSFATDLMAQINKVERLQEKATMMARGGVQADTQFTLPFEMADIPTWVWVTGGFILWRIIR